MRTNTHIQTNTHTSGLWICSSPAGSCLCWFGIHTESSLCVINTHPDTHSTQILRTLSLTEGVKLPDAPAANTWERDERLSHSQQAAKDGSLIKLHPLTCSFTINTSTVNTFPRAYPQRGYNILDRHSQPSPRKRWKCSCSRALAILSSSKLLTISPSPSFPPSAINALLQPGLTSKSPTSPSPSTTTTPFPSALKVG